MTSIIKITLKVVFGLVIGFAIILTLQYLFGYHDADVIWKTYLVYAFAVAIIMYIKNKRKKRVRDAQAGPAQN